jgi:hypothetical protein
MLRRNVILATAFLAPLLLQGLPLAAEQTPAATSGCRHAEAAKHPTPTPDLARIGGNGRTLFY